MQDRPKKILRESTTDALQSAKRGSARAAGLVRLEMKRGLTSLATISSTAPWLGLFGVVVGIYDSFGMPINGSKESIMAALFDRLSLALAPCAFGLMVALAAIWLYKYLLAEVEIFDSDMETAALQLINDLSRIRPY